MLGRALTGSERAGCMGKVFEKSWTEARLGDERRGGVFCRRPQASDRLEAQLAMPGGGRLLWRLDQVGA